MNRFMSNLVHGGFSSCSTEIWKKKKWKCWNAKKKKKKKKKKKDDVTLWYSICMFILKAHRDFSLNVISMVYYHYYYCVMTDSCGHASCEAHFVDGLLCHTWHTTSSRELNSWKINFFNVFRKLSRPTFFNADKVAGQQNSSKFRITRVNIGKMCPLSRPV